MPIIIHHSKKNRIPSTDFLFVAVRKGNEKGMEKKKEEVKRTEEEKKHKSPTRYTNTTKVIAVRNFNQNK